MKNPNILILDNDPELGKSFKQMLEPFGYSVDYAFSITEAIRLVRSKEYAIVYMDIQLPGLVDVDTFTLLKRISPHSELVYIADPMEYNLNEAEMAFIRAGGLIYSPRLPFLNDEIIDATRAILQGKIAG